MPVLGAGSGRPAVLWRLDLEGSLRRYALLWCTANINSAGKRWRRSVRRDRNLKAVEARTGWEVFLDQVTSRPLVRRCHETGYGRLKYPTQARRAWQKER